MHIADGVLTTSVMAGTNVLAGAGVVYGLRNISWDMIPRIGVLAAVFFLASFLRVQLGPASVHLMLNGLLGLLLGWAALPALAVALLLQSILLGFGGVSALGANILCMGVPAVIVGLIFQRGSASLVRVQQACVRGGLLGFTGVLLTCLLFAWFMYISRPEAYTAAIKAVLLAHIPVMIIEAFVLSAAVGFLYRVRPEVLPGLHGAGINQGKSV